MEARLSHKGQWYYEGQKSDECCAREDFLAKVQHHQISKGTTPLGRMGNATLFDDHNDLLLLFYKISSPFCLFLNGLAVYLIIFKSSREMKTYFWHLLHYQIWASAIDILLNILYRPVAFYPLMAIAGYGFFITNLGIPTLACDCLFTNILCGLSVSIVDLFLYRHQCIVKNKLTQRQSFFSILLQFFIVILSINITYWSSCVDPSQWRNMLEKYDPRAAELLQFPHLYYFPDSPSMWTFNFISFIAVLFICLIISILVFRILYILRKESEHLSIHTRKMQRKFFISLIWQVTVPIVFMFVPLIFIGIRTLYGHLGLQMLNNITMMMMSSYGIIATLCLIYFNDPYREFLFRRLKRKKTSPMPSFIQTEIKTIAQRFPKEYGTVGT